MAGLSGALVAEACLAGVFVTFEEDDEATGVLLDPATALELDNFDGRDFNVSLSSSESSLYKALFRLDAVLDCV